MLEVENITVQYDASAVLEASRIKFPAGELTAVIGPNGAGKTTLLRALNRSVVPVSGDVLLDGTPLSQLTRQQIAKRITVVAQENETKFPMTVQEFVLAGRFVYGGAFGWETERDLAAAEKCLSDCDLEGYSGRLMNELSGGERQRVLLARAFATEAEFLLLDEPTNNLDLVNQGLVFDLVRIRSRDAEAAAVIVTHDLNLVAGFADRVIVLSGGRIDATGSPTDVLSEKRISEVFGLNVVCDTNPRNGKVRITPVYFEAGE